MADLIASLPDSAKERQRVENPYSPGTGYYDEYATGWYSGYFAFQILTIFAGKEVLETVKSSQKFAQLTAGIATKMDDVMTVLKTSRKFTFAEKASFMLMAGTPISVAVHVMSQIQTVVKQARVIKWLDDVGVDKIRRLGHDKELVGLLAETGSDGVLFIQKVDEPIVKKILAFSKNGVNEIKLYKFRGKLVTFHRREGVSIDEISKYIDDISSLEGVEGSEKFIKDMATANTKDNFKGLAFEVDRAAYYKKIGLNVEIEPIKQIDLKVGSKYIEVKASNGMIKGGKLKTYLNSAQTKFGENAEFISGNPTKLEISAREGLGDLGEQGIKDEIADWANTQIIEIPDRKNYIGEIEIFLPDEGSIKGVRTTAGTFIWI